MARMASVMAPTEEPPALEALELPAFVEVFEQMQALHVKLWDSHHAMLGVAPAAPASAMPCALKLSDHSPSTKKAKAMSELSVEQGISDPEEELQDRMSRKLMQKAKRASHTMNEVLERSDSIDSLRLRHEWDVPDERVKELKRIQRRLSAGSIASTHQSKKTRQYLFKTDKMMNGEHPFFVLNPNSPLRMCWEVLAVVLVMIEIIFSPLHLYNLSESVRGIFNILQWILTSFWALDIPASFLTAVYINDTLHFRLADIRREYLRGWFLFDLLMLVPDVLVLALEMADGPTGVLRLARVRGILRLGRFVQILRIWKTLERFQASRRELAAGGRDALRTFIQPVICVTLSLCAAAHVLGSLWFIAGDAAGGWVREEGLQEMPLSRQYTRSVEWAIAKLPPSALKTTVELQTPAERWLGIAGTCLAMVCGSIFVSFVTNSMAEFAKSRVRTREILWSVQKYCGAHGISSVYAMQIKRFVEREHRRNELARHQQLLKHLPDGMVRELFHEAHYVVLHCHHFFKELGEFDSAMEMNLCSTAVFENHVLGGDIIFDLSSKPMGMYFMAQGVGIYFHSCSPPVGAARPDKNETIGSGSGIIPSLFPKKVRSRLGIQMLQTILEGGKHLAEPALWVKTWRHQGQLQAMLDCRSVLVSTEHLFKVLQDHASAYADAILYARVFIKELNRAAQRSEEITDLPLVLQHGPTPVRPGSINPRSGQVVPMKPQSPQSDEFFLP